MMNTSHREFRQKIATSLNSAQSAGIHKLESEMNSSVAPFDGGQRKMNAQPIESNAVSSSRKTEMVNTRKV